MVNQNVEAGDWVVDPWDNEMRKVECISDNAVHLEDGGVMRLDEIVDVYLPGEKEGYD